MNFVSGSLLQFFLRTCFVWCLRAFLLHLALTHTSLCSMVSPIWKAASEGDLEKVKELLNEPSSIDIEIKGQPYEFSLSTAPHLTGISSTDHTGATPLIQAVRNGHRDVVKELLQTGGMRKPSRMFSSAASLLIRLP